MILALVLALLAEAPPYWNATADALTHAAADGQALRPILAREQPEYFAAVKEAALHPDLEALWGTCSNVDELAQGVVVDPAIVDLLNTLAGVTPRRDRYTHAGIQHTFGYFLSTLHTAFGFKRERWVRPDVEVGLGLPQGALGIAPARGTLFTNATFFLASIALADDPQAPAVLAAARSAVAPSIANFPYVTLQRRRLSEVVMLSDARVELRTDFVMFAHASESAALLVYSVRDSRVGRPQLITAFPVTRTFIDSKIAALGPQTIATQYNAYVPGLSDAPHAGTRTLK